MSPRTISPNSLILSKKLYPGSVKTQLAFLGIHILKAKKQLKI